MNKSITKILQEFPAPENRARAGFFGMDMETPRLSAELDAKDACEEKLIPEAHVVHT